MTNKTRQKGQFLRIIHWFLLFSDAELDHIQRLTPERKRPRSLYPILFHCETQASLYEGMSVYSPSSQFFVLFFRAYLVSKLYSSFFFLLGVWLQPTADASLVYIIGSSLL